MSQQKLERAMSAMGRLVAKKKKYQFKRKPLIICGPSGVGKGTIMDLLLNKWGSCIGKAVSHTTRAPRPGEVDGREYFFVKDIHHMKTVISKGGFLEHAVVHGNLYGTSFETLRQIEDSGRICVLDIDVFGLRQVIDVAGKENLNRVGIVPVSMQELEQRLRGRGTESEENVLKRLHAAREEVRSITDDGICDHIIVNRNSWEYGYPEVLRLMRSWYPDVKF